MELLAGGFEGRRKHEIAQLFCGKENSNKRKWTIRKGSL